MGTLEIKCMNCGATTQILPDIIMAAEKLPEGVHPYRCPHCMTTMDIHMWDKLVRAFWEFEEVNKELRDIYEGYNKRDPLMQVQYRNYYVPQFKIKA